MTHFQQSAAVTGAFRAALFTAGLYSDNPNAPAEFGPEFPESCDRLTDFLSESDADELASDVADFMEAAGPMLPDSYSLQERAGELFHYSRNGHGTGFFDADEFEPHCDKLQELARSWGPWELGRDLDSGEAYRDESGRFEVWN